MKFSIVAITLGAVALACKPLPSEERGRRIVHLGMRAQVGSLDPLQSGAQYTALAQTPVYEPLLGYDLEVRPLTLVPLLLAQMPEVDADGTTYLFTLRDDLHFQDDPCFSGGVGRPVTATDAVYSLRRHADRAAKSTGWWLFQGRIRGLDQLAEQDFDPDAPVEGLEVLDARRFRLKLTAPYPQLLYVLAMAYSAVVPREAVEFYGEDFRRHPVGTGPYRLQSWDSPLELRYVANPRYRSKVAADGLWLHVYEQEQPMWLKWRVGDLDLIPVPPEFVPAVIEGGRLRDTFAAEGVGMATYAGLDLVYLGFNLEDPIVGGARGKKLRQALAAAIDGAETVDTFYAGAGLVYDGPIPPGVEGHLERPAPYRGLNLPLAKQLLAEAGYPGGEGLPPLRLATVRSGNAAEQLELLQRQWRAIGVRVEAELYSFPELDQALKKKKAQLFRLAWISDYPDAENNLALFYGPNRPPGANHFNFQDSSYDHLYEQARVMLPSPSRTRLYEQMRDRIVEEAPIIAGLARTRYYVWNRRVTPVLPDETSWRWINHLTVDAR